MRKLVTAFIILAALSACSVLAQSPALPTLAPTSAPTSAAQVVPTAVATAALSATPLPPDVPAVWVIDGAQERQLALDPQTGQVLNQLSRDYTPQVFSRDGRWQYRLVSKAKDFRWQVSLNMLDLTRSANPKQMLLNDDVPLTTGSVREVSHGQLLLSKDERRLYVTQMHWLDQQWHTRVYVVDLMTGALTRLAEVPNRVQAFEPVVQAVLAADERWLFIMENPQRQPPATKNNPAVWYTSIAALNLDSGKVERQVEVPGDVQAHGFGLNATLAPDGKTLYLLQEIVRNSERDGYRFVAFDMNQQAITFTRLVERSSGAELGCGTWGLRFRAEGRYLYGYCGADHPIRPAGYFQFLDTQTGLFDPKVVLESKVNPSDPASVYGISYTLASADNRLMYVISWRSKEVFTFDVTQRKVVRSVVMSDTKPPTSFNLLHQVASLFVGTASAKMYAQPGAILSADGTRLYFVDIVDFDKGNGLWAIETSTLKPLGHWLTGKDIYGIQLSADERELFAASPNDYTVYVLDAQTGETRRALKQQQRVFKPIGFVTAQ